MSGVKINEQIAFFRKKNGLTQEELAKALGVTNQAVSKWESVQCCPDIQLLPAIADLFNVSIDELMGHSCALGLGEICSKIKKYFTSLSESEIFENAYRISALLHEIIATEGYRKGVPWGEKDYEVGDVSKWGLSVYSGEDGNTGRKDNSIFFSLVKGYTPISNVKLYELSSILGKFSDINTLKAIYALYGLTINNFDLYVTPQDIAVAALLETETVEAALKNIPVTVKEENNILKYRLDGGFSHIPSLLFFLYK